MLRIVEEKTNNDSTTLRLDGRIIGQWIAVLRNSCEQVFQTDDRVILDLSGVSFADRDGVELLQQLEQRRASLVNCSPFLREQMKRPMNGPFPGSPASE
jgi:ABC-type transporter Mla MlaB component